MPAVMEIVRFQLREGVTDEKLLAAAERFSRKVSPSLPGLERRELLATGEHSYLLLDRFASRQHFDEAPAAIGTNPLAEAFTACRPTRQTAWPVEPPADAVEDVVINYREEDFVQFVVDDVAKGRGAETEFYAHVGSR